MLYERFREVTALFPTKYWNKIIEEYNKNYDQQRALLALQNKYF